MYSNTTGGWNTATGPITLYSNTTGSWNTATGAAALWSNTTGNSNTATGYSALYSNTTGNNNTASGYYALYSNTTGYDNAADGHQALMFNTTGYGNTASGYFALRWNSTGYGNTAVGFQALDVNKTGIGNAALGTNALVGLTSGSYNIALGTGAGDLTKTGNSNIYIGNAGISGSESNSIRIGTVQTRTFIAGIGGVPLSGAAVVVNSSGQLGVVASSARYKKDIKPLAGTSAAVGEKLARLQAVSFRYKTEPESTHYGLIAEEVDKVMPELVVRDSENRPESVQYMEIIPLLLQQWKAQQAEIAQQRKLIERQAAELATLRRTLATRLAALDAGR